MNRQIVLSIAILLVSNALSFAQERIVKFKNMQFNVLLKGMDKRQAGRPVIVLENGLGVGLDHWDTVIGDLSKVAPVFAYDRIGTGKSGKSSTIPTLDSVAANLRGLLSTLRIPPPYILVGHSLGGVFVRAYAGFYPTEVAALVFIDPADFTETKDDWRSLLKDMGIPEKEADEMLHKRLYTLSEPDTLNYGPWSESQLLTSLRKTDFAELTALPVPEVPLYFFVGGKFEVPRHRWSKDFDHPRFFERRTDINIERWKKFIYSSPKGGGLYYLSKAGHFVHRDDAAFVVHILKYIVGVDR